MLVLADNHDSFTHNLAHLVARAWEEPEVLRTSRVSAEEMLAKRPRALILSPGPGRPGPALRRLVRLATGQVPILGICLGHQALGQAAGLTLARAVPVHGHAVEIEHAGSGLFAHCPPRLRAMRYHSLAFAAPPSPLPLEVAPAVWMDARCAPSLAMALRDEQRGWWGLQFHPESFLSEEGEQLVRNFRLAAEAWWQRHASNGEAG